MSMRTTVDSSSPLITYLGLWTFNQTADPNLSLYWDETYSSTNQTGASLIFQANATNITAYGSKLAANGQYTYSFYQEGNGASTIANVDGYSILPGFQESLASWSGDLGMVQLGLTNVPNDNTMESQGDSMNLDYIVVETVLGDDASTGITSAIVDDGNIDVSYSGDWTSKSSTNFHDTTVHISESIGDTVTVQFQAEAIGVYGSVYTSHGEYIVTLDGVNSTTYDGYWFEFQNTLLYLASGLDADVWHTLTITNIGTSTGTAGHFTFDYLQINGTATVATQAIASTTTSTDSSSSSSSSTSGGTIAGAVIGALAAILIVGGLLFWFVRRRRQAQRHAEGGAGAGVGPYYQSNSVETLPQGGLARAQTNTSSIYPATGEGNPFADGAAEKKSSNPFLDPKPKGASSVGTHLSVPQNMRAASPNGSIISLQDLVTEDPRFKLS